MSNVKCLCLWLYNHDGHQKYPRDTSRSRTVLNTHVPRLIHNFTQTMKSQHPLIFILFSI